MAKFKKIYEAPGTGLMTLGLNINKVYTPIVFSEGKTYPVALKGKYSTANSDIQDAIEKTRQFRTGRIKLIESVEIKSAKVAAPAVAHKPLGGGSEFTPKYSKKTNFKTVKTLQDVAELLEDKLGAEYPGINDPGLHLSIAKKNRMFFPNLKP